MRVVRLVPGMMGGFCQAGNVYFGMWVGVFRTTVFLLLVDLGIPTGHVPYVFLFILLKSMGLLSSAWLPGSCCRLVLGKPPQHQSLGYLSQI
jgi:hypothetical protein